MEIGPVTYNHHARYAATGQWDYYEEKSILKVNGEKCGMEEICQEVYFAIRIRYLGTTHDIACFEGNQLKINYQI